MTSSLANQRANYLHKKNWNFTKTNYNQRESQMNKIFQIETMNWKAQKRVQKSRREKQNNSIP